MKSTKLKQESKNRASNRLEITYSFMIGKKLNIKRR